MGVPKGKGDGSKRYSTQKAKTPDAAEKFALWATSKKYVKLVADDAGWATVPPGTRTCLMRRRKPWYEGEGAGVR